MSGLTATRIPWARACDARRWDVLTGCDNPPEVCAVKATEAGCWAEKRAEQEVCRACETCVVMDGRICGPYLTAFEPSYHPDLLDAPLRAKRDCNIIVGIESDPFCPGMRSEWRKPVWDMMEKCYREGRRHNFILLTKNPAGIIEGEVPNLETLWLGVSITGVGDVLKLTHLLSTGWFDSSHIWASFDPILGDDPELSSDYKPRQRLRLHLHLVGIEFAVIGGLTDGHRRVIPADEGGTRAEWVAPVIEAAGNAGCDIFLKSLTARELAGSIHPCTGEPLTSVRQLRELPDVWLRLRRTG